MKTQRADGDSVVAELLLKFASRSPVLQHPQLAVRIARIAARSKFDGGNIQLLNFGDDLVQREPAE